MQSKKQMQQKGAYVDGRASSVGGPFCSFVLKIRIKNQFNTIR